MFSEQLIDQLSQFIIRPHREIYGLDKLGPKKLTIKSITLGCYFQAYRHECTILSDGKKIQLSIFQPYMKPAENGYYFQGAQSSNYLTKSANGVSQIANNENSNQITIFLHTNSGSRLEGLEYCKYLLQHGHIVCLFDYSGSGVSEGEYVSMGLNQSKDLGNVIRYLQQKFQVDKVNLWGRSMGAVTAVLYSAKYPRNVKKIVLDSPFCSFRQLVKEIVNARTGLPEFLFGVVLTRIQQNLKKKLKINLMDINLKNQINKPGMQRIPIFFLISKDDKLVQPIHVQTLYQLHKGNKKILYLQGSHNKPRPSDVREQCAEFLCHKINNVSSQKIIQGHKKQYLTLLSRKYSEDHTEQRPKVVSSSLILNSGENNSTYNELYIPQLQHLNGSQVNGNCNNKNSHLINNQAPLLINLIKKKGQNQSSALSTPREDHSLNKFPTSKISLSQLKKTHIELGQSSHTPTSQMHNQMQMSTQIRQTPTSTNPMQIQMQIQNQVRNTPTNPHKNLHHIDFKKQSKTMAIQYKNKLKEHINKN